MRPDLVRAHVQCCPSAAKLEIKRSILGPDNRVRPDSVERQSVYNDQRLMFCSGGWKGCDFLCGQGIKRWISRQESDQCEIIIIVDDDNTLRSVSVLRVCEERPEQHLTKSYDPQQ